MRLCDSTSNDNSINSCDRRVANVSIRLIVNLLIRATRARFLVEDN